MRKLLRADFMRLFKSKFFLGSAAVMFLLGLLPIDHWVSNQEAITDGYAGTMWYLEDGFFNYPIALFFIISIMTALFVGAEYACGTIRNKIIVGQKRTHIYLSNLITLLTADVIWTAIYLTAACSVGLPLLGSFQCGFRTAAGYILLSLAVTFAMTAVMLLIAMLCQNRAYTAILCMVLTMVLLLSAVLIQGMLDAPEYYDDYSYDGESFVAEEQIQNPYYIAGRKRIILEETMDILPGGQLLQIVMMRSSDVGQLLIYDLCIFALTTGVGILFWRRKDLK